MPRWVNSAEVGIAVALLGILIASFIGNRFGEGERLGAIRLMWSFQYVDRIEVHSLYVIIMQ